MQELKPKQTFDAVVMLTWSDWHREMRSNRFHYSTRFAKKVPVFFVQPDLSYGGVYIEDTTPEGVRVCHIAAGYGPFQAHLLRNALSLAGVKNPLLWFYNPYFIDLLGEYPAALRVFHATEDYFCADFLDNNDVSNAVRRLISKVDLLVAVSEGVAASYRDRGGYSGQSLVLTNGCDHDFWDFQRHDPSILNAVQSRAIYQGGISHKIDFALLTEVVKMLPGWQFFFCGELFSCEREMAQLRRFPNVYYLGKLSPEAVREEVLKSTVGLIPFVENDWITTRSFPLKAFEYISAGLPVVSVPIDSLKPFADCFLFTSGAENFARAIVGASYTRRDASALQKRLRVSKEQSYDLRFENLLKSLAEIAPQRQGVGSSEGALEVSRTMKLRLRFCGSIASLARIFALGNKSRVPSRYNLLYRIFARGVSFGRGLMNKEIATLRD